MCGVAAYAGSCAPLHVYQLLLELQHRGHEAAGVAYLAGSRLYLEAGSGLVYEAVKPYRLPCSSRLAVGHVRYSTSGGYTGEPQPVIAEAGGVNVAVAFNGNIVNYRSIAREYGLRVSWDAEALAKLIAIFYREEGSLADAVRRVAEHVVGSYSLVAISSRGELVAARDPRGVRPLAYALSDEFVAVASETAALEVLGYAEWRELPRAAMLVCTGLDCSFESLAPQREPTPCIFEYVYFSRPDSVFEGVEVYSSRLRMGEELAKLDDTPVDIVAPVPDSGRAAAAGYALARRLPLLEVLYPSRFRGRAFIRPPSERSGILARKYGVLKSVVRGSRIALVDDSIVRGSTAAKIIEALRAAGAREVHFRSASPPVRCPCYLGIDFPRREELIAYNRSVEEVRRLLGADTLLYNTLEGLARAVGLTSYCAACFNCRYPPEVAEAVEKEPPDRVVSPPTPRP